MIFAVVFVLDATAKVAQVTVPIAKPCNKYLIRLDKKKRPNRAHGGSEESIILKTVQRQSRGSFRTALHAVAAKSGA